MIGVYLEWYVYDDTLQIKSASYKSREEALDDLHNNITTEWSNNAVVVMLG